MEVDFGVCEACDQDVCNRCTVNIPTEDLSHAEQRCLLCLDPRVPLLAAVHVDPGPSLVAPICLNIRHSGARGGMLDQHGGPFH